MSNTLDKDSYEIIHTSDKVIGNDTPLGAAKRGKKTVFTTTSYRSSKTG